MRQYNCLLAALRIFKLMMAALALGSFVNCAYAAPRDFKSNPSHFIQHKLAASQLVPCAIGGNQSRGAASCTGMTGVQHG